MPPKRTAPSNSRSEPPLDPQHEDELDLLRESESEEESVTPISAADYRRLLNRLDVLENRELQRQDAPLHPKEPKLAPPPEFHGKISEYRNFMAQCTLTFTLCPHTYPNDKAKVLFTVSRLRSKALDWAREIPANEEHPFHNDYDAFKTALDNIYLDRHYRELCEDKLNNLFQTSTVAAYAADFQSFVEPLEWNEKAKCSTFYSKLDLNIKDAMVIVGRATTFNALVSQAISLDQRQRQARREKKLLTSNPNSSSSGNKSSTSTSKSQSNSRDPNPLQTLHHQSKPQFKSQPTSTSKFNSTKPPFQSSQNSNTSSTQPPKTSGPRGPLSEEEKTRRRQKGLCLYCADPNHDRENCPLRLAREARISAIHFLPSESQPRLPESENYQSQAPSRSEA